MLDRLRRKLFLSLKVMGSDSTEDGGNDPALKTRELLDILRRGSSALYRTDALSFSDFRKASIEHILGASRTRDDFRSLKLRKELGQETGEDDENQLLQDAEEDEYELWREVLGLQSRDSHATRLFTPWLW